MSDSSPPPPENILGSSPVGPTRRVWWRRIGGRFLLGSILAHVIFGVIAAYLVVQTIEAKRKQQFAGQRSPSASATHALEHKVQLQRTKKTMSAPAPIKRVTTTGQAKVALPSMPEMSNPNAALVPVSMAGMNGAGLGLGSGVGGGGGGVGGGGGLSLFGYHDRNSPGLEGTFYDLKQTNARQPTNMTPDSYGKIILDFVNGGFNTGLLSRFFQSEHKLYAPQIWIPKISADLGPAAFQLQNVVKPRMWCVHYKGRVTAPGSFTFHFVGAGDDLLFVRFNGRLVLDRCWYVHTNWHSQANYAYDFSTITHGFAKGDAISVEAGQTYPIEVLIGEQPGGETFATLLQEVDGVSYDQDKKGNPILPVFRMSANKPAASAPGRPYPPHRDDGPVWKVNAQANTLWNH